MRYANKATGKWLEVFPDQDVISADGTHASYDTVMMWDQPVREAFGIFEVPDPAPPPAGKIEVSRWIGGDDRPVWIVDYADPPTPANVTLSDWRAALDLWMRADASGGKVSRLSDVYAAVKPLVDAGNPAGKVAMQQLEYSNMVALARLLAIRQTFGFTEADCIESMWRALQVSVGDFRGIWPLPAGELPGKPLA